MFERKAQPTSHRHIPCREPQGKQPAQPPCQSQLKRGCSVVWFFGFFFSLNPFLLLQGKQSQSRTGRRLSKHWIPSPASVNWHGFHQVHRRGKVFQSTSLLGISYPVRLELWIKTRGLWDQMRTLPKPFQSSAKLISD